MQLTVEKERGGYSLVTPQGKRVAVGIAARETAERLALGYNLVTQGGQVQVRLPGDVQFIKVEGKLV